MAFEALIADSKRMERALKKIIAQTEGSKNLGIINDLRRIAQRAIKVKVEPKLKHEE